MEPRNDDEGLDALMESLKGMGVLSNSDVLSARLELQEQLMARAAILGLGGLVAGFFLSIQTVFLTLALTGDIQWRWWTIPLPTVLMLGTWYVMNWMRKRHTKRLVDIAQKKVEEMKEQMAQSIGPDALKGMDDAIRWMQNGEGGKGKS